MERSLVYVSVWGDETVIFSFLDQGLDEEVELPTQMSDDRNDVVDRGLSTVVQLLIINNKLFLGIH